jgi:hypothetical protein
MIAVMMLIPDVKNCSPQPVLNTLEVAFKVWLAGSVIRALWHSQLFKATVMTGPRL